MIKLNYEKILQEIYQDILQMLSFCLYSNYCGLYYEIVSATKKTIYVIIY